MRSRCSTNRTTSADWKRCSGTSTGARVSNTAWLIAATAAPVPAVVPSPAANAAVVMAGKPVIRRAEAPVAKTADRTRRTNIGRSTSRAVRICPRACFDAARIATHDAAPITVMARNAGRPHPAAQATPARTSLMPESRATSPAYWFQRFAPLKMPDRTAWKT